MKKLLFLLILLMAGSSRAQEGTSFVITNAKLLIGDGSVIENGILAVDSGIIRYAGPWLTDFDASAYSEIIDAKGKSVYPGFIATNTTLGLREIDAVRATLDFHETGLINPHVRTQIAYNAESVIIPTLRTNGVLQAQVVPRGGLVSGTSSVMQLDAWNWEDATIRQDDGIHINWPSMFKRSGWWAEPGEITQNTEREDQLRTLRKLFADAAAYAKIPSPQKIDLRLEAMKGLFNGKSTAYFHADFARELLEIAGLVKSLDLKKAVVIGGADAWKVAENLREANIAVIINRIHALPGKEDDPVALPFQLPYLLEKAGVLYALSYEGDMEVMGTRNLPFTAGTAVGYGLTEGQAVKAITGNAAKILGIDHFTGTLTVGKDATFFISEGNALDMRTNLVNAAFIRGKKVDLGNRQIELYEKYRRKLGLSD